MAIKAYPLNNTLYSADDAQLMQLPVTSGVYGQKGNFDITLNNNMKATISSGLAFFRIDTAKGFTVYMDAASTATISAASTANPRIDRIVLRWKSSTNSVTLTVIKGTAAASPTAPALSRTATQFDICLYDILVDKSVTKIEDYAVTDQRLNDSVCGLLANHAYKIDSSDWQSRITALIAAQGTQIQTAIDDRIEQVVENREIFPEYGVDYYNEEDTHSLAQGIIAEMSDIEDTTPYLFRPTANGTAVGEGLSLKTIVGASVVWNQLVKISNIPATKTVKGVTFTNNGDGSITINGTATADIVGTDYYINTGVSASSGHKYLMLGCPSGGSVSTYYCYDGHDARDIGNGYIGTMRLLRVYYGIKKGTTISNLKCYPQIFDLTPTSSAIADRAYALEQATAGSGVAWLKSYGFFTKPYYAYTSSPSLQSVKVSAHETVEFNQWDEEWELGGIGSDGANTTASDRIRSKNYIPVLPNTTYYFKAPSNINLRWYDGNKQIISTASLHDGTRVSPSNAAYLRFVWSGGTTYNNDICINLSRNGTRNGEYEAHVKHSYPFDSSVELRGVYKLDSNNNIYADGDTYGSDGTVTRNYGTRAYQSGDEELANAITDGTYTVVKLATPTTETAEQFVGTQKCSPSGTERYIDAKYEAGERDFELPVGHETKYAEPIAS